MKEFVFGLIVVTLIGGWIDSAQAQSSGSPASNPSVEQGAGKARDYGSVIAEMFAPITDKLNLTKEQQFQIIAIITETEVRSTPMVQTLLTADQELSELAFTGPLDDGKVTDLSNTEASLMSEMIQMKVRAKADIFKLLTAEQRALIAQQFRARAQVEGRLGSISIY
jgi:Spy/CpxP family protein refolding chaperone